MLIVPIGEKQWHMPEPPQHPKDHRGGEEIESAPDAIDTVAAPAQFFEGRCQEQNQQTEHRLSSHDLEIAGALELVSGLPKQ